MKNIRLRLIVFGGLFLLLGAASLGLAIERTISGTGSARLGLSVGAVLIVLAVLAFVILSKDPTRGPKSSREGGGVVKTHTLRFTVGETEEHEVIYAFDQMWGWTTITVDGAIELKTVAGLTARLVSAHSFQVGTSEVHTVRIEKRRPLMASFARPQPITAFVDGVQVATNSGEH